MVKAQTLVLGQDVLTSARVVLGPIPLGTCIYVRLRPVSHKLVIYFRTFNFEHPSVL